MAETVIITLPKASSCSDWGKIEQVAQIVSLAQTSGARGARFVAK